ncbi:MAG TPA: ankyrin repeat domain-containing protein [Planctomycetota bacterium]|nr:ankyrin repeat domain-containing protein [Planctomycetota bacterium]
MAAPEKKKDDKELRQAVMIAAVEAGSLERVKELAAFDASLITAKNSKGRTAVQIAADRVSWDSPNHLRIAQFLLDKGADCDLPTAARAGLVDYVKKVVDGYPNLIDATDELGRTPLQRAALIPGTSSDCEAITDFLLARGAAIDIFTACTYGKTEALAHILKLQPLQVADRFAGGTPLHWAVRPHRFPESAPRICQMLLEAGAQIEAADLEQHGMSALHHAAAWSDSPEIAEVLLKFGADLDDKDNNGWTALDFANDRKHVKMAALFRSLGAQTATAQTRGKFGAKAQVMIDAAKKGDLELVSHLLKENPALANTRGTGGETPLHWAAHEGHRGVAELLLKYGADVNAQAADKWGGTPLFWAAERQIDLVALLLSHGADIKSINERNGQSVLHACARNNDSADMAELLIAQGAEINVRDKNNRTALGYAYDFGHAHVVDVLKKYKAKEY